MDDFARTERNKIKRLPKRAQYDKESIYRIVDEAPICHVAFTADARQPNRKELDATSVIALRIESASAKIRTGPPVDDEADYALPVWAGVVPLHLQALSPDRRPETERRHRRPELHLELHEQRKKAESMTDPTRSMAGKVCLVTGATAGIGFATALGLARQGATVVGVGRNRDKCQAVAAQIRQETGNPAVEFMQADLSAQAEVRRFAEEFQRSHPRLDVLVNNVGAFFMSRRLSADGIELTWALNYLGVYLLTELLLDTLKASAAEPRRQCLIGHA